MAETKTKSPLDALAQNPQTVAAGKEQQMGIDLAKLRIAKTEVQQQYNQVEKNAGMVLGKAWDMMGSQFPKDSPLRMLLG